MAVGTSSFPTKCNLGREKRRSVIWASKEKFRDPDFLEVLIMASYTLDSNPERQIKIPFGICFFKTQIIAPTP